MQTAINSWKRLSDLYGIGLKYGVVAFCGSLIAVFVWKILEMDFRYALAILGGVTVFCLAMICIRRIEDYLLLMLIFNTAFAQFGKWVMGQEEIVFARGISVGLAELLLIMGYLVWFGKIFVTRSEPPPKPGLIELLISLLIFSQLMSMFAAMNRMLTFLDIVYVIKHAMIYYYIANRIRYRHLKWILIIFLLVIFLESSIGIYERFSGNVGIGHTKGNIESMGTQFVVPGIEHVIRAEGTTADSHSLGLYFVMLLPFPFVFCALTCFKNYQRMIMGFLFLFGTVGLLVTFTRSGWVCFALSTAFALAVMLVYWRQAQVILIMVSILAGLTIFYPQGYEKIINRFESAPWELITERLDQSRTALGVLSDHPFFGCGAGNYMQVVEKEDIVLYDTGELPAHFMVLLIAAEIGLFGAAAYYGIIFIAMRRCMDMFKQSNPFIQGLGLALLTVFVGYLLDGLTSPLGRNPVPYYHLWVCVGLSAGLYRICAQQPGHGFSNNSAMAHQ